MAQTINYHNSIDGSQGTFFTLLSSICFALCMIVTVLGIKIKWFRQHLNIQLVENDSGHKRRSRSISSQNDESIQGIFRKRSEEDDFIGRPTSLPPVRVSNNPTSKSQLFLIRRNLRTTNIQPSPPPVHDSKLSKQKPQENIPQGDSVELLKEKHSLTESTSKRVDVPHIQITSDSDISTERDSPQHHFSDAESEFSANLQEIQKKFPTLNNSYHDLTKASSQIQQNESTENSNISDNQITSNSNNPAPRHQISETENEFSVSSFRKMKVKAPSIPPPKRLTGIFLTQDLNDSSNEEDEKYSNQLHVNLKQNIEVKYQDDTEPKSDLDEESKFVEIKLNDSETSSPEPNTDALPSRRFEKFQTKPRPQPRKYLNSKEKSLSETDVSSLHNDDDTQSEIPQPQPRANYSPFQRSISTQSKNKNTTFDVDDDSWSEIQKHRNLTQKFATNVTQQRQRQIRMSPNENRKNESEISDDDSEKKPRTIRDMKKSQENLLHKEEIKININLRGNANDDAEA